MKDKFYTDLCAARSLLQGRGVTAPCSGYGCSQQPAPHVRVLGILRHLQDYDGRKLQVTYFAIVRRGDDGRWYVPHRKADEDITDSLLCWTWLPSIYEALHLMLGEPEPF